MKTSVYIESSVISYLTARPSNDLVKSARQAITEEWWQKEKTRFTIFVSTLVEEEISRGNPEAAQRRLEVSDKIQNLSISSDAKEIAEVLISTGAVPSNSEEDALHIGIATAHGMHFLLTWNFKHINNAETKSVINKTIESLGYIAPILCLPEELGASS
jgi:hypothetical protein